MRDLSPTFRRIARIKAQQEALLDRLAVENRRVVRTGAAELTRALRPLKLVNGQTILAENVHGRQYRLGIFRGARIWSTPDKAGRDWSVVVYLQSVLKSGKPGKYHFHRTFPVPSPGDVVEHLTVVGAAVLPKKGAG